MNDRVLHRPEDWFALFADTPMDARCGEGSVSTYAWPERSIAAIQHWCPEAKLIVCLREPVARLNSAWQYLRSRGHEPLDDLAEALAAEQNRIDENWHHLWHYRRLSHYETLLEPFYESFGADRIQLVVAEELQTDAPAALAQVFAFLGLAPHAIEATDRPVNTGGELRSGPLGAAARLVTSSPQLKRVLRTIPEGLRHRLQNQVMTRGEVRHIDGLHEEFEPTRTWVQSRLGRTPSAWTED